MSTRCHVIFKNRDEETMTYRHSDGYPDTSGGVLADLKAFKKFGGRRTEVGYAAANWIYWNKMQMHEAYCKEHEGDHEKYATCLLGFEVCDKHGEHGDTEYKYIVDMTDPKKWKVEVLPSHWHEDEKRRTVYIE